MLNITYKGKSMIKRILFLIILFLCVTGATKAEENDLGIILDLQYWSKWLSKGVEAYGQQGAFFKTIDVDFYGSGFGLNVTHRNATSSGYVDSQRVDYRPNYKNLIFSE